MDSIVSSLEPMLQLVGVQQQGITPPIGYLILILTTLFLLLSTIALLSFLGREIETAVPYTVEIPPECSSDWEGEVSGSDVIQCYCPADGRLLGTVTPATPTSIDQAIAWAAEAQKEWAQTTFAQRRRVLRTILRYLLENQRAIATAAALDSGKTLIDASFGEILVTAEKLRWTILHGERALSPTRRPTSFLLFYKRNTVSYEPVGVTTALVSWNYPFHNLISPMISSLFAGNAVIVKVSELTAWSSQYFTSIVTSALMACGHSPDLAQSLACWPTVAPHLTSHPSIGHITFIGSRAVAHHVAASAAESLTPCTMELGGKDPAIILDSALPHLPQIASILMRGVFQSAGQNCIGIERIIATPAVYGPLLALLTPRVAALRPGSAIRPSTTIGTTTTTTPDPKSDTDTDIDIGALISPTTFPHLTQLIQTAVRDGAHLHHGGTTYTHPSHPAGHYFTPTLLSSVPPSTPLATTEVFAPIMTLLAADSATHALGLANATAYSLGASVFGAPSSPEVATIVRGLRSGMVSVNDFAVYYATGLPFGGGRGGGSGYGRFGGEEGLRALAVVKAVSEDRWGGRLLRTGIPARLDYPIRDGRKAWGFCEGVVAWGYGGWSASGVRGKVGGVWRMVRDG